MRNRRESEGRLVKGRAVVVAVVYTTNSSGTVVDFPLVLQERAASGKGARPKRTSPRPIWVSAIRPLHELGIFHLIHQERTPTSSITTTLTYRAVEGSIQSTLNLLHSNPPQCPPRAPSRRSSQRFSPPFNPPSDQSSTSHSSRDSRPHSGYYHSLSHQLLSQPYPLSPRYQTSGNPYSAPCRRRRHRTGRDDNGSWLAKG